MYVINLISLSNVLTYQQRSICSNTCIVIAVILYYRFLMDESVKIGKIHTYIPIQVHMIAYEMNLLAK